MATTDIIPQTVFALPTAPQELGVVLAPASLRRIDFSALDFTTMRRALVEYIQTYFSNIFNDFVTSNGAIMFMELVASVGNILSERSDILVDESFLPTAQTFEAVSNHLALINQHILRATPAVVDVQVSLVLPAVTAVNINAGLKFTLVGSDGNPLNYEIYRAPNDFTSPISIPPGKQGVIAFGIEGSFAAPLVVTSAGGPSQTVDVIAPNVLGDPFLVTVSSGNQSQEFTEVNDLESFGANDPVFTVTFLNDRARITFGDNITGRAPLSGQTITVKYRLGGGIRGRIGAATINESRQISPTAPASAPVQVLFINPAASSGGTDDETLDEARVRAPKEAAALGSATSGEDYAVKARTFSHPVFGSVLKAVAALRTGVEQDNKTLAMQVRAAATLDEAVAILDANFVNENIVEVYALAAGPDNIPVTPSAGLKLGLEQFFADIAVLTDEVRVLDGAIKPVDVRANIIISRTADPGTVKAQVQTAIASFFDVSNFDMGTPLNLSNLYATIQAVSGVKFVTIFEPSDDIIPTNQIGVPGSPGVGFNELITLGEEVLNFYFEKGAAAQQII